MVSEKTDLFISGDDFKMLTDGSLSYRKSEFFSKIGINFRKTFQEFFTPTLRLNSSLEPLNFYSVSQ